MIVSQLQNKTAGAMQLSTNCWNSSHPCRMETTPRCGEREREREREREESESKTWQEVPTNTLSVLKGSMQNTNNTCKDKNLARMYFNDVLCNSFHLCLSLSLSLSFSRPVSISVSFPVSLSTYMCVSLCVCISGRDSVLI